MNFKETMDAVAVYEEIAQNIISIYQKAGVLHRNNSYYFERFEELPIAQSNMVMIKAVAYTQAGDDNVQIIILKDLMDNFDVEAVTKLAEGVVREREEKKKQAAIRSQVRVQEQEQEKLRELLAKYPHVVSIIQESVMKTGEFK